MLEALREFCLSDRGPDALRIETANYLCRMDVLPSGRTRMWIGGRWSEIELVGFEITEEPTGPLHAPPVDDWAYEAMQALHRRDGKRAQDLLEKCLERVGDAPDLLNNLAVAYEAQGRHEEATQLLRQIHERWPDYFFGRVSMAKLAIRAGDFESVKLALCSGDLKKKAAEDELRSYYQAAAGARSRKEADTFAAWLSSFPAACPR